MGVLSGLLRSSFRRGQHRCGAVHAKKNIANTLVSAGFLFLFLLVLQSRAIAIDLPAEAELSQPRLTGSARLTYWGFDVYQASLWTDAGFRNSEPLQHRFALELRYLRAFKGRDIAKSSIDEMKRLDPFSQEQAERWLRQMQNAFPDVSPGDRITGVNRPGQGARFFFNGKPTPEIADPEFSRLFFGIWFSEKSPKPKIRQALLGLTPSSVPP